MSLSDDMKRRMAELDERDAKMRAQLTIPEYTDRHVEPHSVKEITEYDNGGHSLSTNEGTGCSVPDDIVELLPEGKVFGLELRGASFITGWLIDGKWFHRKSDQDLDREHEEWREKAKREHLAFYEKNKELWAQWAAELPDWVDPKGQFTNPTQEFIEEPMGYGYALTAARMVPMYYALGDVILDKDVFSASEFESDEIKEFARTYGTSGNQHGWALAVAKRHLSAEASS